MTCGLFLMAAMLAPPAVAADVPGVEEFEALQAGAATSIEALDGKAFSHPAANLSRQDGMRFNLGNRLFRKIWVSSPSSTRGSDGLGPLYNARSCEACHKEDGRGAPAWAGENEAGLILKLGRGPANDTERQAWPDHRGRRFSDPVYGRQFQDKAVPGMSSEGRMAVTWTDLTVRLDDGTVVTLKKPAYAVTALSHGAMDPATFLSPRLAPPMIGLGLIEAIDPADIRKNADPDDSDKDGISGEVRIVADEHGGPAQGLFGWKAEAPSIRLQAAIAFSNDIGISTSLFPDPHGDCTNKQRDCLARADGTGPSPHEASDEVLDLVTFYSQNLAVPARRKAKSPEVLAGKRLFFEAGCADCHHPKYRTPADAALLNRASQTIWPYSDFLLHDMGEGLSDGPAADMADGREWRTPPLWGIGLTRTVGGREFYLHDGRAGSIEEAILWHDGEARKAREAYGALEKADRQRLMKFLESL
jgi:CxxC motif-containing protein (DUF1111 family)